MEQEKYPLLSFFYNYRKVNFFIIIVIFIITVIIVFFIIPLQYSARVSILPASTSFSQSLAGNLGALGKLAGIDLGSVSPGPTQEMLVGLLKSRKLLKQVINNKFDFQQNGEIKSINLIEFFEIKGSSDREIFEEALKKMHDDVLYTTTDNESRILYIEITTENPFLSAEMANYLVEILKELVKTEVQKEYRYKLKYLESKLDELKDSLKNAENDLKIFLENNIDSSTPHFLIEQLRLRRELEIQTQLFIEFKKQLEVFVADNMINLSDLKILDSAIVPYKKSRPKRILLFITYFILLMFLQIGANGATLIYRKLKSEMVE